MITAHEARNNYTLNLTVLREVQPIEEQIVIQSNGGKNSLVVDFTTATDINIPETKTIEDIDNNVLTVTNHGYITGDTVEIDEIEFEATFLTSDTFSINGITEGSEVKKVIESEKYYKAWTKYYIYPDSISYLNVLSDVEKYFRSSGFTISRRANLETKTINWLITW
jgi:hypothetical protein